MGLMCKPMLVTLPIVLLLLDYWPLNRFESSSDKSRTNLWRLLVEKVPLFLFSLISCVVTLGVQQQAMRSLEHLSLMWRLQNAIASCCIYIWQMVWPANLAVIYPYAENATMALVGDPARRGVPAYYHNRDGCFAPALPIPNDWMVVVSGHACSCIGPGSGRYAGARRSLHLPARNRTLYCLDLDYCRFVDRDTVFSINCPGSERWLWLEP